MITFLTVITIIFPNTVLITNSLLQFKDRNFETIIVYQCVPGYRVSSNYSSEFQTTFQASCTGDGSWQPPPSNISCVPLQCKPPEEITDAYIAQDGEHAPEYFYQDSVKFKCNHGNLFSMFLNSGEKISYTSEWEITCTEYAEWDKHPTPLLITCQPITCPVPMFKSTNQMSVTNQTNSEDGSPKIGQ
ncbi:beta-2-glycoprotein 1-like [Ciona intestinalis]